MSFKNQGSLKRIILIKTVVLIALLLPANTMALEVYSFVTNGCNFETGLVVNTDEEHVFILNTEGMLKKVERGEIELILVYNIHNNPIKSLDLINEAEDYLREVKIDDTEQTQFVGWPIKFFEDLIVFFDIQGKLHLVDIEKISYFSYPQKINKSGKKPINYEKVDFGLGWTLPQCKRQKLKASKYADPTRVISDHIKIIKFLSTYKEGFHKLKQFQKKTTFYAKPFLYEKDTRFGFNYVNQRSLQELNFIWPFYFQWSSGNPYASQGEYIIFSKPVELLPSLEPHAVLRSDVKSHFFTGTFVGNIHCFSAGKFCLIKNKSSFSNIFSDVSLNDHLVFTQFNHLILSGIDYQEYSFSMGSYYPVFGIYGQRKMREFVSNRYSPILRFMKITKDINLKIIYSQSHLSSITPSNDDNLEMVHAIDMLEPDSRSGLSNNMIDNLENYDLKSKFWRFDYEMDIDKSMNIGFSQIFLNGKYQESYSGEDYQLNFTHLKTQLKLNIHFSDYASVKLNYNYFNKYHNYELENDSGESNRKNSSYAVTVEFVL